MVDNFFNAINIKKSSLDDEISAVDFFKSFDKELYALLLLSKNGKSIICRKPCLFIAGDVGQKTVLKTVGKEESFEDSPFEVLQSLLGQINTFALEKLNSDMDLCFFGYIGYEAGGYYEEKLVSGRPKVYGMPDFLMALFQEVYIFDSKNQNHITKIDIEYVNKYGDVLDSINSNFSKFFNTYARTPLNYTSHKFIQSHLTKDQYVEYIQKVKQHIVEGDIYQANFTQILSAKYNDTGFSFLKKLFAASPSEYFTYWKFLNINIISSSPELFLEIKQDQVVAHPIKGSLAAGVSSAENQQRKEELLASEKDASELSMIVDLFRNDLNRICVPGSVVVEKHKEILELNHILHMYSVVSGKLKDGSSSVDAVKACFPSGSITGCPKIRAIEILRDFEEYRRSIYTGSIGYIGNQYTKLNIAIRTVLQQGDRLYFQVGGGIVYDSDPEKEYQECMDKAKSFIGALES